MDNPKVIEDLLNIIPKLSNINVKDVNSVIERLKEKDRAQKNQTTILTKLKSMRMQKYKYRCSALHVVPLQPVSLQPEPIKLEPLQPVPFQPVPLHPVQKINKSFLRRHTQINPDPITTHTQNVNILVSQTTPEPIIIKENTHQYETFSVLHTQYYKNIMKEVVDSLEKKNINNTYVENAHNVYFISNTRSGGSCKYLIDIIDEFKKYNFNFIQLKNKKDYSTFSSKIKQNDILFFQYLLYTDFTISDVLNMVNTYNLRLFIPIHDLYFLNDKDAFNYIYNESIHSSHNELSNEKIFLFMKAEAIIFPSEYIFNLFRIYIKLDSMKVINHIDYVNKDNDLYIPPVNKTINLGIITEVSHYKGQNILQNLFKIKDYKSFNVNFYIYNKCKFHREFNVIEREQYNENDIYDRLKKDSIHSLIFINNYPETYSYAFTKGINSGLPILFTNIGALKERVGNLSSRLQERFFKTSNSGIIGDFHKLLDFIIEHQSSESKLESSQALILEKAKHHFYNELFIGKKSDRLDFLNNLYSENKSKYLTVHESIEPFAIYFPQFHSIPENNALFYKNFTDFRNLQDVKNTDYSVETPLLSLYEDYNLDNAEIVNTQVTMAQSYGFKGFAIYYYWFSHNNVTMKNQIFDKVIDRFFEKSLDNFEVFFIYCNENWSSNIAFNYAQKGIKIENEYNEEHITKNITLLVNKYFIHVNYKKVDNKPVLFIHHPWEMTDTQLYLFSNIGNELCKQKGFDGIQLVMNCIYKVYSHFDNYYHHVNYKSDYQKLFIEMKDNKRYINYKSYINQFIKYEAERDTPLCVNSVFHNFNNTVRFYHHEEKNKYSTQTYNNDVTDFEKFLKNQLVKYTTKNKKTKVSKIFIVNSWNEWGEQMAIEASNEKQFLYLETIKSHLLNFSKY